ncbi:MAG: DUF1707 domain-containing protein [Burkholderiales bacterium]|nr:DUF1707 domain-containing protein [Burkholderiales bacterium]
MTLEPGDEIAAAGEGCSHLRASHADRDQMIEVLKDAFIQGRLAKDEFDLRVGHVLASRSYADLDALTADIPPGMASAPPTPATAQVHAPVTASAKARERAIIATAIFGGLASVLALFAYPVAPVPFLVGIGSIFVSLFLLRTWLRGQRPGGRVPPQRAISTGPGSGRQPAAGGPAGQLPNGGSPRRQGRANAARSQIPRPQVVEAS